MCICITVPVCVYEDMCALYFVRMAIDRFNMLNCVCVCLYEYTVCFSIRGVCSGIRVFV